MTINNNSITIDVEQIIAATREEIAARPDIIYFGACAYLSGPCSDGSVGCVFGQVLKKLGIEIDVAWNGLSIGELLVKLRIPSTLVQNNWLSEIQCRQDNGLSWSSALEKADARFPLPVNSAN